jgi:hypothetical protein
MRRLVLLEIRTVSPKTPRDGKLEILPETADRLARLGEEFPIVSGGGTSTARLSTMACTCEQAAGAPHVHSFVESVLLKVLRPGTQVHIELDELRSRLRITAAPGH